MRTETRKNTKSSWPKIVVRKWLNIQSGADEFLSDYSIEGKRRNGEKRKSCSNSKDDGYMFSPEEGWSAEAAAGGRPKMKQSRVSLEEARPVRDPLNLKMFVGTWNVGGKAPGDDLNLSEWLNSPAPADIYVLGFQEIVPLNAGNVFGAADRSPAAKWLSLIRQALNNKKSDPSPKKLELEEQGSLKPRISFSDLISLEDELSKEDFERLLSSSTSCSAAEGSPSLSSSPRRQRFCLAASKQMVGLFLCVWIRADVYKQITNLKVSCVGRGIMGYLGNKGSISISMTLNQTSFCFVCTHLTSGEKEGDEVKRNADVAEILKRTRFSDSFKGLGLPLFPEKIMDHDKIVWLGDLNYRLAAGCGDAQGLLKKSDWQALLEMDQLRLEQKAGRAFKGWEEGRISFPPTYKYVNDSDQYVFQSSNPKAKRRTPAWCDRILWKGEGMTQMWYVRGESRFSDHRPVFSLFSAKLELDKSCPPRVPRNSLSSAYSAKTQPEEVLVPNDQILTAKINQPWTPRKSMSSSCAAKKIVAEELLPVPVPAA